MHTEGGEARRPAPLARVTLDSEATKKKHIIFMEETWLRPRALNEGILPVAPCFFWIAIINLLSLRSGHGMKEYMKIVQMI